MKSVVLNIARDENLYIFLLGIYLEEELLGHVLPSVHMAK